MRYLRVIEDIQFTVYFCLCLSVFGICVCLLEMAGRGAKGAKGAKTYSVEEVHSMIKPYQEALDEADADIAQLKAELAQAKDEFEEIEDEVDHINDVNGHLKAELAKAQAIIAMYEAKMGPLGINPVANVFIPGGASCTAPASRDAIPFSWGDTETP